MGIGESTRNTLISAVFNVVGSSIVITPYTLANSSDSAYSGQIEVNGTPITTTAIPFAEFKKILKEKSGDLESGGLQLALKFSETIDTSGTTKYKISYGGDIYDIVNIDRYFMKDVVLAFIVELSKRYD